MTLAYGVTGVGSINLALNVAALAIIFAGVLLVRRYKENAEALKIAVEAGLAAATAWKDERDAEKAKADRLEGELLAEKKTTTGLTADLAALRARTDLQPLIEQQAEFHLQIVAALERVATDGEARYAMLSASRTNQERFEAAVAGQFADSARLLRELTTQVTELTVTIQNGHNGEDTP